MERERHYAGVAWGALVGGIVAYEWRCKNGETLSEGVDRGLEHPIGKYAIPALIGTTALHLLNIMPERIDWIHQLGKAVKGGQA